MEVVKGKGSVGGMSDEQSGGNKGQGERHVDKELEVGQREGKGGFQGMGRWNVLCASDLLKL